jgi:hypothetical protein
MRKRIRQILNWYKPAISLVWGRKRSIFGRKKASAELTDARNYRALQSVRNSLIRKDLSYKNFSEFGRIMGLVCRPIDNILLCFADICFF